MFMLLYLPTFILEEFDFLFNTVLSRIILNENADGYHLRYLKAILQATPVYSVIG